MPVYYLETSALLKRYKTEAGTQTVNELFEGRLPQDVLVTSHFSTVEVEAAAARALRGQLLNQRAYRALLGRFAQDVTDVVVLQPMSNAIVSNAAELARSHALRGADAIHLATALPLLDAFAESLVFMTSDDELVRAAEAEGFEVLDPKQPDSLERLRSLRSRN